MSTSMNINTNTKKRTKKPTQNKQSRKKIENKLNTILLSLDNQLNYDLSVDDDFKSSILERDMRVNLDKIQKLPTYNIQFKSKLEEEDNTNNIKTKKGKKYSSDNLNNTEDDEYIKTLTVEKVGNIYYRFDYDKGIIYDMKMEEVGYIDDAGLISILNEEDVEEDNTTEENESI